VEGLIILKSVPAGKYFALAAQRKNEKSSRRLQPALAQAESLCQQKRLWPVLQG
jgi:hypothetical protein